MIGEATTERFMVSTGPHRPIRLTVILTNRVRRGRSFSEKYEYEGSNVKLCVPTTELRSKVLMLQSKFGRITHRKIKKISFSLYGFARFNLITDLNISSVINETKNKRLYYSRIYNFLKNYCKNIT